MCLHSVLNLSPVEKVKNCRFSNTNKNQNCTKIALGNNTILLGFGYSTLTFMSKRAPRVCLPLAPAVAGALGSLRGVPVRGPAMGLSLADPSGVGLGLCALQWLACVDPVTDTSGFPYRPSFDGGLGWCTGAVSCGRRHLPLWVGGRQARVPRVCANHW